MEEMAGGNEGQARGVVERFLGGTDVLWVDDGRNGILIDDLCGALARLPLEQLTEMRNRHGGIVLHEIVRRRNVRIACRIIIALHPLNGSIVLPFGFNAVERHLAQIIEMNTLRNLNNLIIALLIAEGDQIIEMDILHRLNNFIALLTAEGDYGPNAAQYAAMDGQGDILKIMLDPLPLQQLCEMITHGADDDDSLIHYAAKDNRYDILRYLLTKIISREEGADVNIDLIRNVLLRAMELNRSYPEMVSVLREYHREII